MTGPLTREQIEWAAQFCGVPGLAVDAAAPSALPVGALRGAISPMPPPAPPAIVMPATAAPMAPPTAVPSPHTIEKGRLFVEADRLHELDAAMPVLLDLIEHTEKTTSDLQYVANIHGVDVEKPEEAARALTAVAPPLDPRDKRELQQALRAVHDQQDVLAGVLIQIQDKSRELQRDLDMLQKQAETKRKDAEDDAESSRKKKRTWTGVSWPTSMICWFRSSSLARISAWRPPRRSRQCSRPVWNFSAWILRRTESRATILTRCWWNCKEA